MPIATQPVIDPTHLQGVLCAAGTACCWAVGALFFSAAARRIGQFNLNQIRLFMAIALLAPLALAWDWLDYALGGAIGRTGLYGGALPGMQLGLLFVSGLCGLTLGDSAYFHCLQHLGPRRAVLLYSMAPAFTALLAVPLIGEYLNTAAVIGMVLTLVGVMWVSTERAQVGETITGNVWVGIGLGLLACLGQAAGAVIVKPAMGTVQDGTLLASLAGLSSKTVTPVHALTATFWRMVAGAVTLTGFAAAIGGLGRLRASLSDRTGVSFALGGAIFGPVVGVTLSLAALNLIETGVAATIFATAPIVVIPLVVLVYKQKVSSRAILGAVIALAGVTLLTFKDRLTWG